MTRLTATDELQSLRDENESLRAEVRRLQGELATDDLTGLYNARHLRERLDDCIDEMLARRETPALLFIDVDRFKQVNETHGHAAAGRILRQLGRFLTQLIRDEDVAFRYGGDEFVVLVNGGEEGARAAGERIRRSVEARIFRARGLNGFQGVRLTVSIGLRVFRDGDTSGRVLEEADRAMFEAKRRSRNALVAA